MMSALLLQSAAGALRRSVRHRFSLPWPVTENPRLFSSNSARKKQATKEHAGDFYILKHKKQLVEEEKKIREALAMTRENTKKVLEKHSQLLQELELRDRRSAEKYESLKKLTIWTTASLIAAFVFSKTGKA